MAGVVFIPSIIVAPAASMFGDRRPRAQVLAAAYAILALSMAATAVALVVAPPFVAYVMATVAATSITLVRPAHGALLPEVAQKPDELAVANAASGTVEGLGALLGPLLAGLLIACGWPGRGLRCQRAAGARGGGGRPAACAGCTARPCELRPPAPRACSPSSAQACGRCSATAGCLPSWRS